MIVEISKEASKVLRRAPRHIVSKLLAWVDLVEIEGIDEARKVPGFRDEQLKGKLAGKHSIRLSRQWRAIYSIRKETIVFAVIEKVSPHEYKK